MNTCERISCIHIICNCFFSSENIIQTFFNMCLWGCSQSFFSNSLYNVLYIVMFSICYKFSVLSFKIKKTHFSWNTLYLYGKKFEYLDSPYLVRNKDNGITFIIQSTTNIASSYFIWTCCKYQTRTQCNNATKRNVVVVIFKSLFRFFSISNSLIMCVPIKYSLFSA